VMGDQELLTQMFVNVIENAIRHTPSGSHISLAARSAEPAQVDVTIADDGPGIPAAEFARVMRRFVRLDRSRHSPGSGLGLPLAAAVAELHHGSIKLRDNAPGLRVSVLLHRIT
jgi:signal transduction histidine kinase